MKRFWHAGRGESTRGGRQTVDRGMEHVRDEARPAAGLGDEGQVGLDELLVLLLEQRPPAPARGEPVADARAAQMPDDTADVDPRAQPDVQGERLCRLVEDER